MDLDSISNIYKKDLEKFFSNEKIVELIYKEQYGSAYYEANKDACQNKFKDIMKNTVFVPYITMEHLEDFLISACNNFGRNYLNENYKDELEYWEKNSHKAQVLKKFLSYKTKIYGKDYVEQYYKKQTAFLQDFENREKSLEDIRDKIGTEYINQNYNKEIALLRKLQATKKNIIKNYSSFMLDELKQFYPSLNENEYNKILKKIDKIIKEYKNGDFRNIIKYIPKLLERNAGTINHKGLFSKSKKEKADKCIENCIEKYINLVNDKILIETSSYFKHKADTPKNKYYFSILEGIKIGTANYTSKSNVFKKIGKNSERNIRYIFLPVLTYSNEKDYLTAAVHEVMHISKESINKNEYKTGLLSWEMDNNSKIGDLTYLSSNDDTEWLKFAEEYGLEINQKYSNLRGKIAAEEVIHDQQVIRTVSNIENNNLANLHMPYNRNQSIIPNEKYKLFDDATNKFVDFFDEDIKKINRGELSVDKFEENLGKEDFELFSQTANACINQIPQCDTEINLAGKLNVSKKYPNNTKYTNAASILIDKMHNHYVITQKSSEQRHSKIKQLSILIDKLHNLYATKPKFYKPKHSKQTSSEQKHSEVVYFPPQQSYIITDFSAKKPTVLEQTSSEQKTSEFVCFTPQQSYVIDSSSKKSKFLEKNKDKTTPNHIITMSEEIKNGLCLHNANFHNQNLNSR